MSRVLVVLVVLVLLAGAGTARADETPETTVSLGTTSLLAHGLSVEVERDLPRHHVSVAGALMLRSTAGGDYDSSTIGLGAEVRYWFKRDAIWTRRPAGAPVGWYAALRLDTAHTSVTDAMDEEIGAQHTVAIGAFGGYRFAPWRGLEVRPYGGIAVRTDRDHHGQLAGWTRAGLAYGLALGWSW
jgi:hypothetical protein